MSDYCKCSNLQFCFMLWWRPQGRNASLFVGMPKKLVKLRFSCYFFEALCLCCLLGSHAQITLDELDQWVQVVLNRDLVLMLMCISWKAPSIQNRGSFALQTTTKKEALPPCLHQQLGVSTKPFSHKTPNKAAGWEFMCHPSTTASIPDAWKTRMEDRPTENPVLGL